MSDNFLPDPCGSGTPPDLTCPHGGVEPMVRRVLAAVSAMALAVVPAMAGESGKKCTMPVQECIDKMSSTLKTTGWVGLEYDDHELPGGGYKITKVVEGSPAEKAGLRSGDVLYALNGARLSESNAAAVAK